MIGTRRISKRRKVLLAGTTLVLVFIFVQSILPQSVSADESGWVTEKILGPIFRQFGSQPPSQHAVRKAAHVLEFAVLSALLLLCFRGNVLNCVGAGFSSASGHPDAAEASAPSGAAEAEAATSAEGPGGCRSRAARPAQNAAAPAENLGSSSSLLAWGFPGVSYAGTCKAV